MSDTLPKTPSLDSMEGAPKWAIEGMNKALALELAQIGIRSTTVSPTFIETPLTRPFFEDESFREDVLSRTKLGRLGQDGGQHNA